MASYGHFSGPASQRASQLASHSTTDDASRPISASTHRGDTCIRRSSSLSFRVSHIRSLSQFLFLLCRPWSVRGLCPVPFSVFISGYSMAEGPRRPATRPISHIPWAREAQLYVTVRRCKCEEHPDLAGHDESRAKQSQRTNGMVGKYTERRKRHESMVVFTPKSGMPHL